MIFLKKFFSKKAQKRRNTPKKNECWYNNAHEKGEAVRGSVPFGVGGSNHSHENADTQFVARR